jgi:hypothetical protein
VRHVDLGLSVRRGIAHRSVDALLITTLTSDWIGDRLPCEGSTAKHPCGQCYICFEFHRSRSRSDVSPFAGNGASRYVLVAANFAAERRLTAAKAAFLSVTPCIVDAIHWHSARNRHPAVQSRHTEAKWRESQGYPWAARPCRERFVALTAFELEAPQQVKTRPAANILARPSCGTRHGVSSPTCYLLSS